MDFYNEIINLSDEELERVVQLRINQLERESKKRNQNIDVIGYDIGYNPILHDINKPNVKPSMRTVYVYDGYIPKNTRMIYGATDEVYSTSYSNIGCYYYVDDDSYILDFIKYIRNKNLRNEYELFSCILYFSMNYFHTIEEISRYDMFKLINTKEGTFFDPVNEHKFSSYKGKGNAMCSEKSLMANNLLNFLGLDTSLVLGTLSGNAIEPGYHAFNIIEYKETETNKKIIAIIDFASHTKVLDEQLNINGYVPFIGEIELEENKLKEYLAENDNSFEFEEYGYMRVGDEVLYITDKKRRKYSIGRGFTQIKNNDNKIKKIML